MRSMVEGHSRPIKPLAAIGTGPSTTSLRLAVPLPIGDGEDWISRPALRPAP